MNMPNAAYLKAVDDQVRLMLAKANAMHPEFEKDCLTSPGLIKDHWADDVRVTYVNRIADSVLRADAGTMYDDDGCMGPDLLGLFSPAIGRRKINRIQVQWQHGDYTPRRNFTLLHELGHYLQQTDDELAERICMISSMNYEKRFEEDSCNRFASQALLPDTLMRRKITKSGLNVRLAGELYEDARWNAGRNVRVSRDVIMQRIGDFLPGERRMALTLTTRTMRNHQGRRVDAEPQVRCRVHNDRMVDYGGSLTDEERLLLAEARGLSFRRHDALEVDSDVFEEIPPDKRPVRAAIAKSYGKQEYAFMMFEY